MIEIITANSESEYEAAGILFKEYAVWLNIDLGFQNFDEELLQLKEMYSNPNGAILLSRKENIFIGCVAVRKKEKGIAELKRMFIKEGYRKEGVGALLLQKALEIATNLHYKKIRLDTLDTMTPAINLYKKYGFYEIEPYYFNPEKNAVFFEKLL
jgi:ribosomal protein S18 acetylase RimI-like enzyme